MPDADQANTQAEREVSAHTAPHQGFVLMQQLTIYIKETDHVAHRPLYLKILELIKDNNGAGATMLKGVAGYSSSSHAIQTAGFADIQHKLPLVIVVVETASWIEAILPQLETLLQSCGGLLTIQDLEAHRYLHPNLAKKKE
jgi:PII-like signaling protein